MLAFSLIILCLNLDALSYGIANGAKGRKFSFWYTMLVCVMSTVMFAIPLFVSKHVFQYFDETICKCVNAGILIILGIFYLLPKNRKNKKKQINNKLKNIEIEQITQKNQVVQNQNYSQNILSNQSSQHKQRCQKTTTFNKNNDNVSKNLKKNDSNQFVKVPFSRCFLECLAISVDAIFTAFLSGFSESFYWYAVVFYALTNFLAIYLGNKIFYKLGSRANFSFGIISGLLFILLGILKFFGI